MERFYKKLKQIGLGDHESMVYAVLLEHSPSNATLIAKKCDLSRSSVYTTLASLISKGLVSTTYRNEVKQFIAEDYSAIEDMLNKEKESMNSKFNILDTLRDEIQKNKKSGLHVPEINFFEGQEGLKKIYLSMMRNAAPDSTLYLLRDEFVLEPEWKFIFQEDWHDKVKKIKTEKNILTKLLINDSATEKQQVKYYTSRKNLEFRTLPKGHSADKFAIYNIGDTVSILSMETNNLVGIKITNQHIAKNLKNLFDIAWKKSK